MEATISTTSPPPRTTNTTSRTPRYPLHISKYKLKSEASFRRLIRRWLWRLRSKSFASQITNSKPKSFDNTHFLHLNLIQRVGVPREIERRQVTNDVCWPRTGLLRNFEICRKRKGWYRKMLGSLGFLTSCILKSNIKEGSIVDFDEVWASFFVSRIGDVVGTFFTITSRLIVVSNSLMLCLARPGVKE